MKIAWGISWEDGKKGRVLGAFCALLTSLTLLAPTTEGRPSGAEQMVSVIVREMPGAGSVPEALVKSLGGDVERQLGIIHGFSADVPASSIDTLLSSPMVLEVTEDRPLKILSSSFDPTKDPGASYAIGKSTNARDFWNAGYTGQGIDVALIDTGVAPVEGLNSGQVINGPDLSFEQGSEALRYKDTNGHGTHLAGIIAGREPGVNPVHNDQSNYFGVAPGARIVNVKVANAVGAADVSQVIAGINWVINHRYDNGLNIRVLNLSFGTDNYTQPYVLDPLAFAAEAAWRAGIVVVAAAGNSGFGDAQLNDPAYDPFIIAVGANDTKGTFTNSDDTIPDWSSRGDGVRNPDFVAPGKSIVGYRVPESYIDYNYGSTGRVGDDANRFFRGTGTSQAAAVASGGAALLLSQRPNLTPDQVKYILKNTTRDLPVADPQAQGAGAMDLAQAMKASTPSAQLAKQVYEASTGLGSLELSRGTMHVVSPDGVVLEGDQDIFGVSWEGAGWSGAGWSGAGWSGAGWSDGLWNGAGWSGAGWSGAGWSGVTWNGAGWSGAGWSGAGWSGAGWSGAGWSGAGWSGAGWSGAGWSGAGWSGAGWSGAGWSGAGWSGAGWSGAGWSGAGWSGAGWSGAGWSGAGWS